MYCPNCGTKIGVGAVFCQNCGKPIDNDKVAKNKIKDSSVSDNKNYRPIFWKYFWIGVLLNIFYRAADSDESGVLTIIFLIAAVVYIYKFSITINEAMLSIGKQNWWPLGLLSLVPFGFWIALLIVRSKLKPHGKWVSKHESFKMSKGL